MIDLVMRIKVLLGKIFCTRWKVIFSQTAYLKSMRFSLENLAICDLTCLALERLKWCKLGSSRSHDS